VVPRHSPCANPSPSRSEAVSSQPAEVKTASFHNATTFDVMRAQRLCLWFSLSVLAGCPFLLISAWTPLIQTMPEYVVLATAPLGFVAVLSAERVTQNHAFRSAHLPGWAKGLWAALLVGIVIITFRGYSYDLGSSRGELAAFAPWWAAAAVDAVDVGF